MKRLPRALVVLNPAARHNSGRERYARIAPVIEKRFEVTVAESGSAGIWQGAVGEALKRGVRVFIAAGGDGTVSALGAELYRRRSEAPPEGVVLGAVGLGSSNDFHKPVRTRVLGVPLRLDLEAASLRDLARVRYLDQAGVERERFFLVSASIGVCAAANALFNRGGGALGWLKARWTGGAIMLAALRAIAWHGSLSATLELAGAKRATELSNLSVMKSPYLSGSFTYDIPVDPASGLLAVNLCESMGRLELLRTLAALARGRFLGRSGTHHWMARELQVRAGAPFDLELDGEVFRACSARFDLASERLKVCG